MICIIIIIIVEIKEKAKSILKSNESVLKDVIIAAGLYDIIHIYEQEGLITSPKRKTLVSRTTGQTEDERAHELLDSITSVVDYSTDQMDVFLCVLYENGAIAGKNLAKRLAKECEL